MELFERKRQREVLALGGCATVRWNWKLVEFIRTICARFCLQPGFDLDGDVVEARGVSVLEC